MGAEKLPIEQVFGFQNVSQTQHQCYVCAWPRHDGFSIEPTGHVILQRRYIAKLHSAFVGATHRPVGVVFGNAPVCDLGITQRQSAKCHHQLAIFYDVLPAGLMQFHMRPGRHHMGQNYLSRRRAVAVHSSGAAAHQVNKSV